MTRQSYIIIFFTIIVLKTIVSLLLYFKIGNAFFGGGNDSEYYNAYAIGIDNYAVNLWPIILRKLHDFGLYSRGAVTFTLAVIGIFIIPLLFAKISISGKLQQIISNKDFWIICILISLYPSLYYQTTDLYREIAMIFLFGLFLLIFKTVISSKKYTVVFFIRILIILFLCFTLFKFRPYLGAACFLSIILYKAYSFKKYPLLLVLVLYITILTLFFHLGLLESFMKYRSIFDGMQGGANFYHRVDNTLNFPYFLILNWKDQILGMFFINRTSIFVFIVESLLFMYALYYIIKNRQYADSFASFLIIFFLTYTTAFLLGNDNLGTATRLRLFSYLSILILFFTIKTNKINTLTNILYRRKT